MKTLVLLFAVAAALLTAGRAEAHMFRHGCNSKLAPKKELRCAQLNKQHALATIAWAKKQQRRIAFYDGAQMLLLHRIVVNHRWLYRTMDARVREAKRRLHAVAMPSVDSCLDTLIRREGGYNVYATNPTSGAYGAPQALPGSKMASAGADWRTNLATQIRWMWGYVTRNYGGSCQALAHSYAYNWY